MSDLAPANAHIDAFYLVSARGEPNVAIRAQGEHIVAAASQDGDLPTPRRTLSAYLLTLLRENRQVATQVRRVWPVDTGEQPALYLCPELLFGEYDGAFQPRPGCISFLNRAAERYSLRWLTYWPEERLRPWLRGSFACNAAIAAPRIPFAKDGKGGMGAVLHLDTPFFWLDADPEDDHEQAIKLASVERQRLIVPRHGADELAPTWDRLLMLEQETLELGRLVGRWLQV